MVRMLLRSVILLLSWMAVAAAADSQFSQLRNLRLRGGTLGAGDYSKMKLSDIQKELRSKGLSTKGLKGELVQRLIDHGQDQADAGSKRGMPVEGLVEHESNKIPKSEQLMGQGKPPVRITVDEEGDNPLVRLYNAYEYKDQCRRAGFKFDAMDRAWTIPVEGLMDCMRFTDAAEINEEQVLERLQSGNFQERTPEPTGGSAKPGLKVDVKDGVVHVAGNTYDWREKLRAIGFRWDASNQAWTSPEADLTSNLQLSKGDESEESFAVRVIEAIEGADPANPLVSTTQAEVEQKKAVLSIEEGTVLVRNSFDIKDHLRGLGFRFNAQEKAWTSPLPDVLMLSDSFTQESEITLELLLSISPGEVPTKAELPQLDPSLVIAEDYAEVSNSYSIKDSLKALGFTWSAEKSAWIKPKVELMEQCGVGDEKDLSIAMILGVAENAAVPGDNNQKAVTATTPYSKVEDGEVRVFNSYSVKDKLRSLGFRWNAAGLYWGKAQQELSEIPGAEDVDFTDINSILALEASEAFAEKKQPYLSIMEEEVTVFNSYDIKDQLRARGFRWDQIRGCWHRPKAEVAAALGLTEDADSKEITIEKVLSMEEAPVFAAEAKPEEVPTVSFDNGEILVYNSYSMKDGLKAMGFRFDSERKAWAHSTAEVKSMLDVADQEVEITIDRLKDYFRTNLNIEVPEEQEPHSGDPAKGVASDIPTSCNLRSPSPAMVDQTPGETLLSSMGRSLQGWSKSASAAG